MRDVCEDLPDVWSCRCVRPGLVPDWSGCGCTMDWLYESLIEECQESPGYDGFRSLVENTADRCE